MKSLLMILSCVVGAISCTAQKWSIEVSVEGVRNDTALLAYYLGGSQYIQDTVIQTNGKFVFSGEETLTQGVYLVVFRPDNKYFQLLVGEGEDQIQIKASMDDIQHPTSIKGSKESQVFYDYIRYLTDRRPKADTLRKQAAAETDSLAKQELLQQVKAIDDDVKEYQRSLLAKHPNSLTGLLINSNLDVELPEFTGTEEEIQIQTYLYVKAHYFDKTPLHDPRYLRTPVMHQRIEYYINKLTPQVPDSLIRSVDFILQQFDTSSEAFKIYLVHFLNTYAKSKVVGMDAVYVHLVDDYYAKGYATWTDSVQLDKILRNAATLRPILIGKPAPDLLLQTRDGKPFRLHSIESPYTVLFFWDPECGHCKKSMPDVITFYNTYKPKGVELVAVCTQIQDGVSKCWEYLDSKPGTEIWLNVVDPMLRSRFKQIYDVKTTPQIFILDKDKKIIMKKIGAEQLPDVMDRLMEMGS